MPCKIVVYEETGCAVPHLMDSKNKSFNFSTSLLNEGHSKRVLINNVIELGHVGGVNRKSKSCRHYNLGKY